MFTLAIYLKSRFLQRFDRTQMIYAGKFRRQSSRDDFHLANFTTHFRLPIEIYVTANRIFNVCKGLFDIRALGMTSWQFRTAH